VPAPAENEAGKRNTFISDKSFISEHYWPVLLFSHPCASTGVNEFVQGGIK